MLPLQPPPRLCKLCGSDTQQQETQGNGRQSHIRQRETGALLAAAAPGGAAGALASRACCACRSCSMACSCSAKCLIVVLPGQLAHQRCICTQAGEGTAAGRHPRVSGHRLLSCWEAHAVCWAAASSCRRAAHVPGCVGGTVRAAAVAPKHTSTRRQDSDCKRGKHFLQSPPQPPIPAARWVPTRAPLLARAGGGSWCGHSCLRQCSAEAAAAWRRAGLAAAATAALPAAAAAGCHQLACILGRQDGPAGSPGAPRCCAAVRRRAWRAGRGAAAGTIAASSGSSRITRPCPCASGEARQSAMHCLNTSARAGQAYEVAAGPVPCSRTCRSWVAARRGGAARSWPTPLGWSPLLLAYSVRVSKAARAE